MFLALKNCIISVIETAKLMDKTSITEKDNKLKLKETSGFSSTVMSDKLVCEDLQSDVSRSMILSESSETPVVAERIILPYTT